MNLLNKIRLRNCKNFVTYCRVSSEKQNFDRQEYIIDDFEISNKNINILKSFYETVSGTAKLKDRKEIINMFQYLINLDKEVIVLVTSVDRLSRNINTANDLIKCFSITKAKFYFIEEDIFLKPNKNNLAFKNSITKAQDEVKLIRKRMENGFLSFRENGGKVGRKIGYRKSKEEMQIQYAKDIEYLMDGFSYRKIQSITGTSLNTLQKLKKLYITA